MGAVVALKKRNIEKIVIPENVIRLAEVSKKIDYPYLQLKVNEMDVLNKLWENEISVYDPASVRKYKTEKVKSLNKVIMRKTVKAIVLTFLLVASAVFTTLYMKVEGHKVIPLALACTAIFMLIPITIIRDKLWVDKKYMWDRTELRFYQKPIPYTTIEKMGVIDKLFGGKVKFYIDELLQGRKVFDPFLLFTYNKNFYYVDVWDEPEFEPSVRN